MATMQERLVAMPEMTGSDLFRFWSFVKVDDKGCMVWTGALADKRYGKLNVGGQIYIASRLSYYISTGDDPGEWQVCHTCNNSKCVHPDHLYLGDNSINQLQAFVDGRKNQKGELSSRAKLTEDDVRFIRDKVRQGVRIADLARSLGVAYSTAKQAADGTNWGHVN